MKFKCKLGALGNVTSYIHLMHCMLMSLLYYDLHSIGKKIEASRD